MSDRVYPFYTGGYEFFIYNLARKLLQNHRITIFTSMDSDVREIEGVEYVKISGRHKYVNSKGIHNVRDSLRFGISTLNKVTELNTYDLVVLNTIPYLLFGYVLSKLKTKKISIFYESWYEYLNEFSVFSRKTLYHEIKNIVDHSNAIVAVSSPTKDSLVKNYHANNVYQVPAGISMSEAKEEGSKQYDIIYLGRLAKIKHVDNIIMASKRIQDTFPYLSVAIAGQGEENDKLTALVKKLGLSDAVSFLGSIKEDKKYSLLRSSKIFVLPSEREGFSISALEAMYCGAVPVIARPRYDEVFGTSDFVIENKTGLYFELGNIDDLAKKILRLLVDRGFYNHLRKDGMDIARKYDWNSIARAYDEIFATI